METSRSKRNRKKKKSKPVAEMSESEMIQLAISRSMQSSSSPSSSKSRKKLPSTNTKSIKQHHHTKQRAPPTAPPPLDGRYVIREGSESHALMKISCASRTFFKINTLDWTDVVEFISFENGTCPVCQEVPACARVGECGHRVCLPCFIRTERHHHHHQDSQQSQRTTCSICTKDLSRSSLRRSTVRLMTSPVVGDVVEFQLLTTSRSDHSREELLQLDNHAATASLHNPCWLSTIDRVAQLIEHDALDLVHFLAMAEQDAVELRLIGKMDMAKKELQSAVSLVRASFALLTEEAERDLTGCSSTYAASILVACQRTMRTYESKTKKSIGVIPSRRWESGGGGSGGGSSGSSSGSSGGGSGGRNSSGRSGGWTSSGGWAVPAAPAAPAVPAVPAVPAAPVASASAGSAAAAAPVPTTTTTSQDLWYVETSTRTTTKEQQASPKKQAALTIPTDDQYFYYQLSNGQYCFLHPLMVRILKEEYSDYHTFPSTIKVKIIQIENDTLHESNYSKFKYLKNIPYGVPIMLCEIQLSGGLVSDTVLKKYKSDLSARAKVRQQKMRRDDRFSNKAKRTVEQNYKNFVFENGSGAHLTSPAWNPSETPELTSQESFPTMRSSSSGSSGSSGSNSGSSSSSSSGGAWSSASVSSDVRQYSSDAKRSMIKSQAVVRGRTDPKWAELTSSDVAFNKDGQATVKSSSRLNLHAILSKDVSMDSLLSTTSSAADDKKNKETKKDEKEENQEEEKKKEFGEKKIKKNKRARKKKSSKGVMLFSTSGGRSR